MERTYVEIEKEFYEKIKNADKEAADEMMIGIAIKRGFNPAGYGFYSPMLYEQNGKYYFSWLHGESCD